jgi:hypothetical protein
MPNFLIVGAAKSGTTSLYEYLRQHPAVFMPKWKELSFFIGDHFGPLHKVKKPEYYGKVFDKVQNESAVGEASTSYLYDESAPKKIKEGLGFINIIIILRNPVEMSYSLYNHQVRKEGETLKTFEAALEAEEDRKRDLTTFGKDNVLILLFDELVKGPVKAAQKVFRFLGVDDSFVPQVEVHNPAGQILNIPRFWEDAGLFQKTASFVFSKNPIRKIPHLLRNIGRRRPKPIDAETARRLKERFYDDICSLEQLIGKDLSAWK